MAIEHTKRSQRSGSLCTSERKLLADRTEMSRKGRQGKSFSSSRARGPDDRDAENDDAPRAKQPPIEKTAPKSKLFGA